MFVRKHGQRRRSIRENVPSGAGVDVLLTGTYTCTHIDTYLNL